MVESFVSACHLTSLWKELKLDVEGRGVKRTLTLRNVLYGVPKCEA